MGYTRGPSVAIGDACPGTDLFKLEAPPVDVQGVPGLVPGEIEIRAGVPVKVLDEHPGPVVIVEVGEDVQFRAFRQGVGKMDPGILRL